MVIWKRLNAKAYKELPKVSETDERTVSHLPVLSAPVLRGYTLGSITWSVKNVPFFRSVIAQTVKSNLQLEGFFRRRLLDPITHFPLEKYPPGYVPAAEFDDSIDLSWLEQLSEEDAYVQDRATILQFHKAYKSGKLTPSEVGECVIKRIEELKARKLDLNIVTQYDPQDIRELAAASTERYKSGNVLSVLDGTPMGVKDFLKVDKFKLTFGLANKGDSEREQQAMEDSAVLRMRMAGVVIIGITSAHEGGLGGTGAAINRKNFHVRSAMNTDYCAGGSSGGSGAAVGAGLCPLALGTDGGGSIRIPASFNGIVGVKATFARVASDLNRSPLVHTGPLCWTVADALAAYHYISGPSLRPTPSLTSFVPPKIQFRDGFQEHFISGTLPEGFKVGIDFAYVKQAYDEQVGECVLKMAEKLKQKGAQIVPVNFPEIFESFRAFVVTFGAEGVFHTTYGEFNKYKDDYSSNLVLLHTLSSKIKASHFLLAGQQKTRLIQFVREIVERVDVILFPGTGTKPPPVHPGDLKYGVVNLGGETEIARYTWLGNMTGLPAVQVPMCWYQMVNTDPSEEPQTSEGEKIKTDGTDYVGIKGDTDIPCSIQVLGSWWREDNSFLGARALEVIRNSMMEKRSKVKFQLNLNSMPVPA
ncbi:uncharacterized protein LOC134851253 isoform X2 [Symsagittifera roscoffensis]